jgi:glycosyltransferase involved in cell wall biosynthesis
VGISSLEILNLIGQTHFDILPPNITFVEHVSHNEIRNHLSRLTIGVVPYPESAYHNERFPIKIVEYAAMGIPMIICNSNYLDSVIPSELIYFSKPTAESIYESVLEIVNFPNLATYKAEGARKWSNNLTYINRTKRILILIGEVLDERP